MDSAGIPEKLSVQRRLGPGSLNLSRISVSRRAFQIISCSLQWLRLAYCLLVRKCPSLITVEEELPAEYKQPDPKRKAQLTAWNTGTEDGSQNGSGDAALNEVNQ